MSTEENCDSIIEYRQDGVVIKETHESPLSGDQREIVIERYGWEKFPMEKTMQVEFTERTVDDEGDLETLRQGVRFEPEIETNDTEDFWQNVERDLGIQKRDGDIMLNGDTSSKADLVNFVEYMFRHEYISPEDAPIKSGYKWNLINTKAEHQNGDDMYQQEQIHSADTDIWLETKYSTAQIKSNIKSLSEEFAK
jgi:hypothetical protein